MFSRYRFLLFWSGPALLLGALLWHTWNDPDIWYHLTLGRGVWLHASSSPPEGVILKQEGFRNIYWIFQLAAFGSYTAAGITGVRLLILAAWFATFALWTKAIGVWRPFPLLFVAAPAILVCFPRMMERPETFSYVILCLQMVWLSRLSEVDRIPRRWIVAWVASEIVWANVHGFFFLGPLLVALWLACDLFRRPFGVTPLRRDAVLLLGLLLLASVVSPFGVGTWKVVVAYGNYLRAMSSEIAEFQPLNLGAPWDFSKVILAAWLAAVGAVAAGTLLRRRRVFEPALAVVGLFLALQARRNAPMAVFLAAPLWRVALGGLEERLGARRVLRLAASGAAALVALLCLVFAARIAVTGSYRPLSGYRRFGTDLSPALYPVRAARYFTDTGFTGRVFNHSSDGGYLTFYAPNLLLYGDSRFIDVSKTREYFKALARPSSFFALDRNQHFDAVLLNIGEGQSDLFWLLTGGAWEIVSGDLCHAVLVNRSTAVGAAAPFGNIRLFNGEDLSIPLHASCATEWLRALAAVGHGDFLLAALNQLAEAPRLPPGVVQVAREVGRASHNEEILAAAARLARDEH